MTYLDLINNVLTRLREDTIIAGFVDSNPFYRVIGSHVNDAKDRVEDAWQWSALRGTDTIDLSVPTVKPPEALIGQYELPNSADNHYVLKGVYVSKADPSDGYYPLRWINKQKMISRYSGGANKVEQTETPSEFTILGRAAATGNLTIAVYPRVDLSTTNNLSIDRVRHQAPLVNPTDRLLVPSLPVYTLATALASRERGEIGGTPTSELFALADRHLSDAIAQDSALFANELDWFTEDTRWTRTNIRYN